MWVKCTRCAHTGRDRMTVSVGATRSHLREAENLTYTKYTQSRHDPRVEACVVRGRSVEPDRNRARGVRSIRHSIFARVARVTSAVVGFLHVRN